MAVDGGGLRKKNVGDAQLIFLAGEGSALLMPDGDMGTRRRRDFFFFKQKPAYELTEGDWSSDVCSSDLAFDVRALCRGGGVTGQAGAMRLAIARALCLADERHRKKLREQGLLTRDPRVVERKKPGRAGARKRFQFSKR